MSQTAKYTHHHTIFQVRTVFFNSSSVSDAYMHQQNRPSLFQMMACRLFDHKTLSEPMLAYLMRSWGTNFNEFWLKIQQFLYKKINLIMSSESWCLDLCVFIHKTDLCPRTREKHWPFLCKHSADVYDWFLVYITFCWTWAAWVGP